MDELKDLEHAIKKSAVFAFALISMDCICGIVNQLLDLFYTVNMGTMDSDYNVVLLSILLYVTFVSVYLIFILVCILLRTRTWIIFNSYGYTVLGMFLLCYILLFEFREYMPFDSKRALPTRPDAYYEDHIDTIIICLNIFLLSARICGSVSLCLLVKGMNKMEKLIRSKLQEKLNLNSSQDYSTESTCKSKIEPEKALTAKQDGGRVVIPKKMNEADLPQALRSPYDIIIIPEFLSKKERAWSIESKFKSEEYYKRILTEE